MAVFREMRSMGYLIDKCEDNLSDALKEVLKARDEGRPY